MIKMDPANTPLNIADLSRISSFSFEENNEMNIITIPSIINPIDLRKFKSIHIDIIDSDKLH